MSRRPLRPSLGALALACLLLPACGGGTGEAGSGARAAGDAITGEVLVFAAASLTDAFSELAEDFEQAHPGTSVSLSFGASSALAQQVLAGAPADVFASASAKNMDQVVAAGDATDPVDFAANEAQVAVAPGSADRVRRLADLARPDVKVALCQPEVPCGVLARQVLDRAGLTVRPVTQGLDVRSVLGTVASGEVDAGIVYATDVRAAAGGVTGLPVPPEAAARTAYPIATTSTGRSPELGRLFRDHVLSEEGRRVLDAAGFARP